MNDELESLFLSLARLLSKAEETADEILSLWSMRNGKAPPTRSIPTATLQETTEGKYALLVDNKIAYLTTRMAMILRTLSQDWTPKQEILARLKELGYIFSPHAYDQVLCRIRRAMREGGINPAVIMTRKHEGTLKIALDIQ